MIWREAADRMLQSPKGRVLRLLPAWARAPWSLSAMRADRGTIDAGASSLDSRDAILLANLVGFAASGHWDEEYGPMRQTSDMIEPIPNVIRRKVAYIGIVFQSRPRRRLDQDELGLKTHVRIVGVACESL